MSVPADEGRRRLPPAADQEANSGRGEGSLRRRRCHPNKANPETSNPIDVGSGTGMTPLG
jgi:hypothetical protein